MCASGFYWGSTNAYTEDAAGKPVIMTGRLLTDYRHFIFKAGAKPFLEVGPDAAGALVASGSV